MKFDKTFSLQGENYLSRVKDNLALRGFTIIRETADSLQAERGKWMASLYSFDIKKYKMKCEVQCNRALDSGTIICHVQEGLASITKKDTQQLEREVSDIII